MNINTLVRSQSLLGKAGPVVLGIGMVAMTFAGVLPSIAEAASSITITTVSDPISGVHHTPFTFSCPSNPLYNPVTVSGSATADAPPGKLDQYHVQLDWGDGHQDNQIEASAFGAHVSGVATRSFSGTHTYTTVGTSTKITARVYHNTPPGGDGDADSFIAVITCIFVPPANTAAVLVTKSVDNAGGGTAVASNFTLNVTNSSSSPVSFHPLNNNGTTTVTITPGSYSITETATSSYTPSYSAGCSGSLTIGLTAICHVTNTFVPPTTGTLHVVKLVTNDNGGTAAPADFQIYVKNGANADVAGSPAAGSATGHDYTLAGGSYTVSEDANSGYAADLSACGTAGAVTVTNGQTTNCTITNNDIAPSLSITKVVSNPFRSQLTASAWTVTATGDQNVPTVISGAGGATSGGTFQAGTYTLTEDPNLGNYTASFSCVKNNGLPTTSNLITLLVGDSSTCTLTNTELHPGVLHVIKNVINDEPNGFAGTATADNFTLTVTGGNPAPASFNGSETGTDVVIDAGASYSVAETGGPVSSYAETQSVTGCSGVMPENGDVTCTITNNDNPATTGGLTVIKVVDNTNGGPNVPSSFQLSVSGGDLQTPVGVTSGQSNQFDGGSYQVSETYNQTQYTQSFSESCAGGNVTVTNGQSVTCTITNTAIAPHLTLVKVVDTANNGGTAVATDWTLAADGPTPISGANGDSAVTNASVHAGTYTLSESNGPAGYTAGDWSCSGDVQSVDNTVTLDLGQSATCSITNVSQPGTIHVVKHVTNDNGGSATAGQFSFTVDGGQPSFFDQDGQDPTLGTKDVLVSAGSHTVTEVPFEGYGASYETCSEMNVANGGEVTCTITNNDGQANLTIVKNTIGADGTFTFDITQGETTVATTSVTTQGNSGQTSMGIDAGTYDLTEEVPTGWTLQGSEGSRCVYDNQSVGNSIPNGESIIIHSGDNITCTFTNTATGSDLSVVKTVDDATPDAGQNITFTLNASNAGPAGTTGAMLTDLLPAGLEYVSDNGNGSYATSTGVWTIGTLPAASSTSLEIVAKVTASAGQTVINVATTSLADENVNDYNGTNNTGSVSLTVNTPTPPSGGGGGGNGPPIGNGPIVGSGSVLGASTSTVGQVLGASCGLYMEKHLRRGSSKNDLNQTIKLQGFLNKWMNSGLPTTGFFGPLTEAAVKAFQAKYSAEILAPWNLSAPTGLVYLSTLRELNLLECPQLSIQLPALVPWNQNPNAQ